LVAAIHARKTAALLSAATELGAIAGGATREQQARLAAFGRDLGLAFQIVDDCLDVTATSAELGKTTGSDASLGKQTYPAALGLEPSLELARELKTRAIQGLRSIPGLDYQSALLEDLAEFVVARRA
jgi:geranylgeranyl pyrophosphate synthase